MSSKPQPLPKISPEAEKRKAAALRENLLKRKAQAQQRDQDEVEKE